MSRYRSAKNEPAYKRRAKPRSNQSGEGYNRSNIGSRFSFEININHSRADKSIEAAKRALKRDIVAIEKAFSDAVTGFPTGRSGTMQSRIVKRPGGVGKAVATIDSKLDSDRFITDLYDNYAPEVGRMAVDNIRNGIKNPENPPISFRYETGLMFNSVRYHKDRYPGRITIRIGWLDTFRKYFDFQERGTSQVGAMNAFTTAYRKSVPKAHKMMSSFLTDYTHAGGFNKRYKK